MKNLRLLAFLGTSLFVSSSMVLAACSDDDTSVTSPTPDGGGPDGGGKDVNTGGEDTGTGDASNDNNVAVDSGLRLDNWGNQLAENLCDYLTRCCFGQTHVADGGALDGGGTFDRGRCVTTSETLGFEGSLIDNAAITKGKVTFDDAKAKDCLAKIAALPCDITGAQLKAARAACFDALAGTVAAGGDCRSSIECAPGNFCLPDADGGVDAGDGGQPGSYVIGKCTALRGSGGNCSIVETGGPGTNEEINDSLRAEEACSYRGSANTNLRCDSYDFVGGAYRARADWKCAAQVANDAGCNDTQWCSDGICDSTQNYVCASPAAAFTPASCSSFKQ